MYNVMNAHAYIRFNTAQEKYCLEPECVHNLEKLPVSLKSIHSQAFVDRKVFRLSWSAHSITSVLSIID